MVVVDSNTELAYTVAFHFVSVNISDWPQYEIHESLNI